MNKLREMIHNTADLFDHFMVENARQLDRAIYKGTACGAWAALVAPGARRVGTRVETWTAKIHMSIPGAVCVSVRKKGAKSMPSTDAPFYVQEFLLLDSTFPKEDQKGLPQLMHFVTWDQLRNMKAEGIKRVTQRGPLTLFVTFTVDAPVMKAHQGGVVFGSIVEGSDAEVFPEELLFPFSEADLDRAIENIEDEADRLWREANGEDDED
jgi:hypothetical protein